MSSWRYQGSTFGHAELPNAAPAALAATESLLALRLPHFRRPEASSCYACSTFDHLVACWRFQGSILGHSYLPDAAPEALWAAESLRALCQQHFRAAEACRRCARSTFEDVWRPGATPQALSATHWIQVLRLQHFGRLTPAPFWATQGHQRQRVQKNRSWRPPKKGLPLMSIPYRMDPKWRPGREVGLHGEALLRQNKYFLENSTANRQGKGSPRENKYF